MSKCCNFIQTQCTETEMQSDCSMRPRPQNEALLKQSFNRYVYNHHISYVRGVACTSYFYFYTSFSSIKALPALRQAQISAMANEHSGQKHVSNHKVMILCWVTIRCTKKQLFARKKSCLWCLLVFFPSTLKVSLTQKYYIYTDFSCHSNLKMIPFDDFRSTWDRV